MNQNFTDIPLPQNTKLYCDNPSYGGISVIQINSSCTATATPTDGYADFKSYPFCLKIFNQNVDEIQVKINDKIVSSLYDSTNSYYSLNGFDNDFVFRFVNYESPTVCFLPLVKSKDNNKNIDISSGYISTIDLTFENVDIDDYVLLTNQNTTSQNKLYRITSKTGNIIGISADADINGVLDQDQDVIFTRVLVENSSGSYYFGVNNSTPYEWVSQTKSVRLPTADYGITINSELTDNKIAFSVFSLSGVTPIVGETVAINVNGGGKTTGVYKIYRIVNGYVYFYSIYPSYLFIHQFLKVKYDFNTFGNSVWIVDSDYVGSTTYIYSTKSFAFRLYDSSSILGTVSNWAKQVGGKNDTIVGFTIYTDNRYNNYIKFSDKFYFGAKVPQWAYNGAKILGLSIDASYSTNMLDINQEEVTE